MKLYKQTISESPIYVLLYYILHIRVLYITQTYFLIL